MIRSKISVHNLFGSIIGEGSEYKIVDSGYNNMAWPSWFLPIRPIRYYLELSEIGIIIFTDLLFKTSIVG